MQLRSYCERNVILQLTLEDVQKSTLHLMQVDFEPVRMFSDAFENAAGTLLERSGIWL